MLIALSPLTAAATAAAVLLCPVLTALVAVTPGRPARRELLISIGLAAVAASAWLLVVAVTEPELDPLLVPPAAGLAGVAAVLATTPVRAADRNPFSVLALGTVFSATVYSPVAVAVFSDTDGLLGSGLGTLDLGGALPVLVASGAAIAVLLVFVPRPSPASVTPGWGIVPLFGVAWVLWIIWLAGMELVVDALTPQIVLNAIIAPLASCAAWLVVQRVRHARTTAAGVVGGLLAGLVAVTAGCGFLDGFGAAIVGVIGGAVSPLVGYTLARRTGRPGWLLAAVLVIAGGSGTLLLGVLATRSGLMFTGQPEVIFAQAASVAAVAVYAAVVTALLTVVTRVATPRSRVESTT